MDINVVTSIISQLGVPVALLIAMFWLLDKERSDHKEDLDYLLERETEFWGYVEKRIMPPMVITF